VRGITTAAAIALIVAACTGSPSQSTTTTTGSTLPTSTTTTEPSLETGPGVVGTTIHLGAFLPLTGPLRAIGESVLAGHTAYWAYVNDDLGGVAGQFNVTVEPIDTAYDPDTAGQAFNSHRDDLLAISSSLGSPVTAALLDVGGAMPIVVGSAASTWGEWNAAVFDLALPTYRAQVRAISEQVSDSRIGFIAPSGGYGDDCLAGIDAGPDVVERYPAGTTDFEAAVTALDGVDVAISCVTSTDLGRIIATWDLLGGRPPIYATSASFDPSLFTVLDSLPEDLFVAGAPPPYESEEPGMTLFRTVTGDGAVDAWTFLGYTQAATMHLLLEQAIVDHVLTWNGVLAARSELGDVDFGFGWGSARFDGTLPVVPVTIQIPDVGAVFGLQPTD
jgi:ABC-type branched-subunit amino acid transport system substrate-binding protein